MADFKPDEFDLVLVRYDTGRVRPAWWTGQIWDSRVPITQKRIVAWKPISPPDKGRESRK